MFKVIHGLLEYDCVAESSGRRAAAAAPCGLEIRLSLEHSLPENRSRTAPVIHTRQDTGHKTQDTGNKTQDRGDRTQETRHGKQDTGNKTQDRGDRTQERRHRTQDTGQDRAQDTDTGHRKQYTGHAGCHWVLMTMFGIFVHITSYIVRS